MKGDLKPLTLEEYAGFFHSPELRRRFSHDQLNQVIYMHGFLKLHRWQKANIVDALNSVDLMQPERSTVRGDSSAAARGGDAVLTLEEVKKDIQVLDWQECPLGSIITVSAADAAVEAQVPISSFLAPSPSIPPPAAAASRGTPLETARKRKRKRKTKRMGALTEVSVPASLPVSMQVEMTIEK